MVHLIDKDALVAEINKRIIDAPVNNIGHQRVWAYNDVKDIIDTLELKEVDLEKEIDNYISSNFFGSQTLGFFSNRTKEEPNDQDIVLCARHFFELGLKAKDWEKERMEECPYRQVGCTMYEGEILECRGACSWVVDYPKLKELKAQKGEEI